MKINRPVGYGLLAMGYMAQNKDEKIIMSQTIAKKNNTPPEYLQMIMQQLVRANILKSKRGPHGGYSLARPASKITMLEIIEAIDGPINVSLGMDENTPRTKFVIKTEKAHDKVTAQTRAAYKKIKLSDLI